MPDFVTPIFKFLSEEYAKSLIEKGVSRIGTLHDFRRDDLYEGEILDRDEGRVTVSLTVNTEEAEAGILDVYREKLEDQWHVEDWSIDQVENDVEIKATFSAPDCYIHCSSKYLFSETMVQQVKDGNNYCVLITDFNDYYHSLPIDADYQFLGVFECDYSGRTYIDSIYEIEHFKRFYEKPIELIRVKPETHQKQHEVRAVWWPHNNTPITPVITSSNNHSGERVLIDFSGFYLELFTNGRSQDNILLVKAHMKDGSEAYAEIYEPFEMLQIIFEVNESGKELVMQIPSHNQPIRARNILNFTAYFGSGFSAFRGPYLHDIKHLSVSSI